MILGLIILVSLVGALISDDCNHGRFHILHFLAHLFGG